MRSFLCPLALALLSHGSLAGAAEKPLDGYRACSFSDTLQRVAVTRAANLPMERTVETAVGNKTVSVADGYRFLFAAPPSVPFANLKIERSVAGHYAQDKQAILAQVDYLAGRAPVGAMERARSVDRGIDVVALRPRQVGPGLMGMLVLFDDAQEVVATAYVSNGTAKEHPFPSPAAFEAARDGFVADLVQCMAAANTP